ncbi:type II toxin-antitoxin system VapB family antitoxin [Marinibacterium profundimaris]|uniref:Transcription factor n=1 Tax=Marinibacterium profundimaris TaxID=1679460 RepID=A0A225NEH0_9RHOB|nr:type II toxin-antitoxin system VapB family antitoxin [Marinibacterium profundimaris]OWU71003.1 transcription factor [Marinibacterium profundimaris]
MPLYVKDPAVSDLAQRLARLRGLSKTEAVRLALEHELERAEAAPDLVDRGTAFVRALHARTDRAKGQPVDKAFIDSLYETE